MTQEDKELLLKDLCARLPYRTIMKMADGGIEPLLNVNVDTFICNGLKGLPIPYLRPMSSMTEEEKKKCSELYHLDWVRIAFTKDEHSGYERGLDTIAFYQHIDYLNSRHFDFRGLIEKGLALEAPERMYKTE